MRSCNFAFNLLSLYLVARIERDNIMVTIEPIVAKISEIFG